MSAEQSQSDVVQVNAALNAGLGNKRNAVAERLFQMWGVVSPKRYVLGQAASYN